MKKGAALQLARSIWLLDLAADDASTASVATDRHLLHMIILHLQLLSSQVKAAKTVAGTESCQQPAIGRAGSPMSKYRLSDSFPYLLARAGARMGELFADELAELGITLPMYRVMAALWERDGQRLSELSDMIGVEISTLSRMIGTMKTAGYLSRRRMEGDERSVKISLTASGRKQVERLIPRAQHYEALATHGFSPLELEEIKERLRKVLSNLTPTESRGPL